MKRTLLFVFVILITTRSSIAQNVNDLSVDEIALIGSRYFVGSGVPVDYEEGLKWTRIAAEQGHPGAQFMLGSAYHQGHGVVPDIEVALSWYESAADQGDITAQAALGYLYLEGESVSRNYQKAFKWFLVAAKQNDGVVKYSLKMIRGDSQQRLAELYLEGQGVPQNFSEAAHWYEKAALTGFVNAQHTLGIMYYLGVGVDVDYCTSYIWFSIAASYQDDPEYIENRELVASLISPEQLSDCQEKALITFKEIEKVKTEIKGQ